MANTIKTTIKDARNNNTNELTQSPKSRPLSLTQHNYIIYYYNTCLTCFPQTTKWCFAENLRSPPPSASGDSSSAALAKRAKAGLRCSSKSTERDRRGLKKSPSTRNSSLKAVFAKLQCREKGCFFGLVSVCVKTSMLRGLKTKVDKNPLAKEKTKISNESQQKDSLKDFKTPLRTYK